MEGTDSGPRGATRDVADAAGEDAAWPELPWRDWGPTMATLHRWVQIVGSVHLAIAPPIDHWWHVPLRVTPRGLTTGAIEYRQAPFQVDVDFVDHRLRASHDRGGAFEIALEPRSVASFYRDILSGLRDLEVEVDVPTTPVEVADAIPFNIDERHASYDPDHAAAFLRAVLRADRLMRTFRVGFLGEQSPIHFSWGRFDLTASRYSGRLAPLDIGGVPHDAEGFTEEEDAGEEHAIGWWPSSEPHGPAFFAYVYPEPEGIGSAEIRPTTAAYDASRGEFILPYDAVRLADDPEATVIDFFRSTYEAGALLAGWDRPVLEPLPPPEPEPDGFSIWKTDAPW